MSESKEPEATDASRVILLGASNLTLAWPRIMQLLQIRFAAPLEVYTANGMGRSYVCERSAFGLRQLPGILLSELWESLPADASAKTPSAALLTDFGNDLLYGREPEELVNAAEECVNRIRAWDENCHLVMTRPPVESVDTLGWLRFTLARFALFPLSPLTLDGVRSKTLKLDAGLLDLASQLNVPIFQPRANWYWLDPIHVRRKYQTSAFAEMMSLWPSAKEANSSASALSRPKAAKRWIVGSERHTDQPSVALEGTSVFAY